MKKLDLSYCNNCEDLVEYDIVDETITEEYRGETVRFQFEIGRCRCCDAEVATDIDYNSRRSQAKIRAYKQMHPESKIII